MATKEELLDYAEQVIALHEKAIRIVHDLRTPDIAKQKTNLKHLRSGVRAVNAVIGEIRKGTASLEKAVDYLKNQESIAASYTMPLEEWKATYERHDGRTPRLEPLVNTAPQPQQPKLPANFRFADDVKFDDRGNFITHS